MEYEEKERICEENRKSYFKTDYDATAMVLKEDYYTFIPINEKFKNYYGFYPKNECADAGYGIYVNYEYIKKHNIVNYVKYQNWEEESKGKNPRLFKVDKKM